MATHTTVDKSSFAGILIAAGGILTGLILEGGHVVQLMQPTAFLIVFGGTLGAVMLQFPIRVIVEAFRRISHIFLDPSVDPHLIIAEMVGYAKKARKEGIMSLDTRLPRSAILP